MSFRGTVVEIFMCAQREALVVGRQVQRLPDRYGPRKIFIRLACNPFTWVGVAHQRRDCLTYKCESTAASRLVCQKEVGNWASADRCMDLTLAVFETQSPHCPRNIHQTHISLHFQTQFGQ